MNSPEANPATPAYELKDELARYCLSSAQRDVSQKLAWANSVCLVFLLIGILGARRGVIAIKPAPPLAESVPVVVIPVILPPQQTTEKHETTENDDHNPVPVAVVMPQTPNLNFSVPTIGWLVVPANLAAAPPLEPMQKKVAITVGSVASTGGSGERPEPPYPKLAQETGEQGTVILTLNGDDAGNVLSVEVKSSSGYPILDRATGDFIKRHWRVPTDAGTRLFQTSITYKLQF